MLRHANNFPKAKETILNQTVGENPHEQEVQLYFLFSDLLLSILLNKIKVVNIYNTSAGAITVSTKVLDSSSTTTGVWNETSVSANTQERVLQNGEVIVLEANDILKINAGSGSVIDAIISLLQIT